MTRVTVCLLLYAALAVATWFVLGSRNLPRLGRLAAGSVATTGRVTATDCHNHGAVRYAFDADGREVADGGPFPGGARACDDYRPGDRVTVWYVPGAPDLSSLREPAGALARERFSVGTAAALAPWLLVAAVLWWTRGWARTAPEPTPTRPP